MINNVYGYYNPDSAFIKRNIPCFSFRFITKMNNMKLNTDWAKANYDIKDLSNFNPTIMFRESSKKINLNRDMFKIFDNIVEATSFQNLHSYHTCSLKSNPKSLPIAKMINDFSSLKTPRSKNDILW